MFFSECKLILGIGGKIIGWYEIKMCEISLKKYGVVVNFCWVDFVYFYLFGGNLFFSVWVYFFNFSEGNDVIKFMESWLKVI